MLIAITSITPGKQWRDFQFLAQDLELGFAVLMQIAKSGDSIVEAKLIEDEKTTIISLDFLDQQPCCNPITQLRTQWE
ncbi:hypothetical protein IC229_21985 [Spirosoma sp. BT702]|uniref:Uncharacterized protein n=1 Tax=Spirosoma profusum TaxID=2771354 RepID=A0A927AS56_9BACT|nr:hypothetical protein [Spirosoma profusum]MBD2703331.1 hypothetical protein [Spirosoma profusum]